MHCRKPSGKHWHGSKCPRRLVVVDALPRNTMGKVAKKPAAEIYADLFTA